MCLVESDPVTPWTVSHQAPLFMGFPRQEYWSGLPFPALYWNSVPPHVQGCHWALVSLFKELPFFKCKDLERQMMSLLSMRNIKLQSFRRPSPLSHFQTHQERLHRCKNPSYSSSPLVPGIQDKEGYSVMARWEWGSLLWQHIKVTSRDCY